MSAISDILEVIGDLGYVATSAADLGRSSSKGCGPALEAAKLRGGEWVLDLGCGSGGELAIAAELVGSAGGAYGLDPNTQQLDKALALLAQAKLQNAQLYEGYAESIPLADNSLDCVYSNCVLNLVHDKAKAFCEVRRVLRPGGRFIFMDVVQINGETSPEACNVAAIVLGCTNGVSLVSDYEDLLIASGFAELKVTLHAPIPFSKIERQAQASGLALQLELLDKREMHDALASVVFSCVKPGYTGMS